MGMATEGNPTGWFDDLSFSPHKLSYLYPHRLLPDIITIARRPTTLSH
jgi:hypothetical protein